MAKKKTVQVAAQKDKPSEDRELTWHEERFVENYIDNGGNATQAYIAAGYARAQARQNAHRLLTKEYISEAVEARKEEVRATLNFNREKALRILIAMVTATVDDFSEVLADPARKENFRGLGDKRYALMSAEKSFKNGNSVKLVDRRAALNDLWEKLGLDKDASEDDRISFLERFANLGQRLGRPGSKEGSE